MFKFGTSLASLLAPVVALTPISKRIVADSSADQDVTKNHEVRNLVSDDQPTQSTQYKCITWKHHVQDANEYCQRQGGEYHWDGDKNPSGQCDCGCCKQKQYQCIALFHDEKYPKQYCQSQGGEYHWDGDKNPSGQCDCGCCKPVMALYVKVVEARNLPDTDNNWFWIPNDPDYWVRLTLNGKTQETWTRSGLSPSWNYTMKFPLDGQSKDNQKMRLELVDAEIIGSKIVWDTEFDAPVNDDNRVEIIWLNSIQMHFVWVTAEYEQWLNDNPWGDQTLYYMISDAKMFAES